MTRREFFEKYNEVLRSIQIHSPNAEGEGYTDMLISSVRGHFGETYTDPSGKHVYPEIAGIPEDFDWDACYEDIKNLV